jgi:hypothetical protein
MTFDKGSSRPPDWLVTDLRCLAAELRAGEARQRSANVVISLARAEADRPNRYRLYV